MAAVVIGQDRVPLLQEEPAQLPQLFLALAEAVAEHDAALRARGRVEAHVERRAALARAGNALAARRKGRQNLGAHLLRISGFVRKDNGLHEFPPFARGLPSLYSEGTGRSAPFARLPLFHDTTEGAPL